MSASDVYTLLGGFAVGTFWCGLLIGAVVVLAWLGQVLGLFDLREDA